MNVIDSLINFISKQWSGILGIGVGLLALTRFIDYIEQKAKIQEEIRRIRNHENNVIKNREKINVERQKIIDYNWDQLDMRLHDNDELRG